MVVFTMTTKLADEPAHACGDAMQQASRFLKDIPTELREEWNLRPFNPYGH